MTFKDWLYILFFILTLAIGMAGMGKQLTDLENRVQQLESQKDQ